MIAFKIFMGMGVLMLEIPKVRLELKSQSHLEFRVQLVSLGPTYLETIDLQKALRNVLSLN